MLILDKQLETQVRVIQLRDAFIALKNYIQLRINMFDESSLRAHTTPLSIFLYEDRYHVFSRSHRKDRVIAEYLTLEQVKCYIQACAQRMLDEKNAKTQEESC